MKSNLIYELRSDVHINNTTRTFLTVLLSKCSTPVTILINNIKITKTNRYRNIINIEPKVKTFFFKFFGLFRNELKIDLNENKTFEKS